MPLWSQGGEPAWMKGMAEKSGGDSGALRINRPDPKDALMSSRNGAEIGGIAGVISRGKKPDPVVIDGFMFGCCSIDRRVPLA